ncbi:efflux RND transporter periplasmic adaptor subunit [Neobacillus sp. OS1-2]|uniref:efflux RND transporter periplasmic adaptor subunit n=1 Tax=Neobacillus sp. OS1-2 TaxID=3070680 RepID=UPI0027E150CC|nr:efflux RND transporter periplasmic adaptor subunit [Neobacillus sp. OS1-2]WML41610.1 efflux RND transporter periplasmic adaptor subunit [Neobacillus sp. OS1-2]
MQVEKIPTSKRKKWIVIGLIASIVTIAAINITVMQNKKNSSKEDWEFVSVTEKEISNTKLVSGQVVPGKVEALYADPSKGKVKELFVKEGQEVKQGDKLFSYDNSDMTIQEKQLELDKKSTNLRVKQGNEKMASLKKDIQKAKVEGAAADVLAPLEAQLQDLQYEQQSINLEMEKNKLAAEQLKTKQEELIVYSSASGIVQKVDTEIGENLTGATGGQGDPIMQIASKDPFRIEGTLTELQKAQILPDQPILITSKAVSNKTWKGKITEVSEYPVSSELGQGLSGAAGNQTQNISYYNFKAALETQEDLSPGYHVSIQVELTRKRMLAIPRSSIIEKEDSKFVYVVNRNKVHKKTLTIGIGDGEWTEVLEGLKAGEKVVNNPSDRLYDGMEVKGK